MMTRLLLSLLLTLPLAAQFWQTGAWQTVGVGPLANRPATCAKNRHVFICSGAGCSVQGGYHYCTDTDTWTNVNSELPVSPESFGAVGDGSTNDTAAITAAFAAAAGKTLWLQGKYKLDNSSAPFTVDSWTGRVYGAGNAELICTTLANACVKFTSASNVVIEGVALSYGPAKTTRNGPGHILQFTESTNIQLSNLRLYNANSSALLMEQCDGVQLNGITIYDVLANGVFITSSRRITVDGVTGENVEDYVVELSKYDSLAGDCSNITVNGLVSINSFSGALVNGCTDVSISNFSIDTTYGHGVSVIQDSATTVVLPDRVSITGGTIKDVGLLTTPNLVASGIFVGTSEPTPASPVNVIVSNVLIHGGARDGVEISPDNTNLFVTLGNITAVDTQVGFRLGGGGQVVFSNLAARTTQLFGMYITNAGTVLGQGLTLYNTHTDQTAPDTRAMVIGDSTRVWLDNFNLIDTQGTPTGFQIDDFSTPSVLVTHFNPYIPSGAFSLSRTSSSSRYETVSQSLQSAIGYKFTVSAVANGVDGCANANGCWKVLLPDGRNFNLTNKAAATTQGLPVFGMADNYWVSSARLKTKTACTGVSTLSMTLGTATDGAKFVSSAYDLKAAVSASNFAVSDGHGATLATGEALQANLTSSGADIDQVAAGCAFDVHMLYTVLP